MKIESRPSNPSSLLATTDSATAAAILAREDARKTAELARASREQAQQSHVAAMKRAADKLREMAGDALGSALWQGLSGVASAALSAWSAASDFQSKTMSLAAGGMKKGAAQAELAASNVLRRNAEWIGASASAASGLGRCDPFAVSQQQKAVQKQELDAQGQIEAYVAQAEGETCSEAQRLEGSLTQLVQKIDEARHSAILSSLRA
jgi:hypothetical protein